MFFGEYIHQLLYFCAVMLYNRTIKSNIESKLGKGKAILVIGPRQVGKTTLIKEILEKREYLFLDADDPVVRDLLTNPSTLQLKSLIGNYKLLFIDEAQRVENIGVTMKIIVDQFKDVQLIISGSSSFELTQAMNEPLTGRKWEYELLPISWQELLENTDLLSASQDIDNRLIYGMYPDILNNPGEEKERLGMLVNSYLYKDILAYANIRKPDVLEKLVQALAFQIGKEVSYNELAQMVGIDKNTVSNYIDILEDAYVIFKLGSYSNNLRNEIKFNRKIYFYDLGVRNMVINNFTNISFRLDKGEIWENFLIAERRKLHLYHRTLTRQFYWRTSQQQEVDLIEVKDGAMQAFEFKWNNKKSSKLPKTFTNNYHIEGKAIDRKNYGDFLQGII